MAYLGDFALGATFDTKFCTVNTSGVPTTLAGTPVISAYPDNSTTQLTAGITLTVDFDAVTGLHNVRVVATGGNGYAAASNYQLVITTGTVSGASVVGYVVGEFSIQARTLNWGSVSAPSTTVNLSATTIGVIGASGIANTSFTAGAIDASALAANCIGSSEFTQAAADVVWTSAARTLTSPNNVFAVKKNAALNNLEWVMYDSADHITPKTLLTVTVQASIDGGAFANVTNITATEVSSGVYKINLAAADTNGTTITYKMTAAGADNRYFFVVTQV